MASGYHIGQHGSREHVHSLGQHSPAGTLSTQQRARHTVGPSGYCMALGGGEGQDGSGGGGTGKEGALGKIGTWRPMNMGWSYIPKKGL